jgi:hypothetical protein
VRESVKMHARTSSVFADEWHRDYTAVSDIRRLDVYEICVKDILAYQACNYFNWEHFCDASGSLTERKNEMVGLYSTVLYFKSPITSCGTLTLLPPGLARVLGCTVVSVGERCPHMVSLA